jgi:hypothetical protein
MEEVSNSIGNIGITGLYQPKQYSNDVFSSFFLKIFAFSYYFLNKQHLPNFACIVDVNL